MSFPSRVANFVPKCGPIFAAGSSRRPNCLSWINRSIANDFSPGPVLLFLLIPLAVLFLLIPLAVGHTSFTIAL
jgi:hypothetical protein